MGYMVQAGNGQRRNRAESNLPASRPVLLFNTNNARGLRGKFEKNLKKIKRGLSPPLLSFPFAFRYVHFCNDAGM